MSAKVEKRKRGKLADMILLVLTAMGIIILGLGFFIIQERLGITSRDWKMFISSCLLYTFFFLYAMKKVGLLRAIMDHPRRITLLAIMITNIIVPMVVVFFLFHLKVLPFPRNMWPYVFGTTLTCAASGAFLTFCVRTLKK